METKIIKASELIEILSEHPDARICILNVYKDDKFHTSLELEVKYIGGTHNMF